MSVFFQKDSTTFSLNKLGDDKYRFAMLKSSQQGASQELTKKETEEMIRGLARAFQAKPEEDKSQRFTAISKALRAYAEDQNTTIEALDKEISSSQVQVGLKK